jgi:glycerate dehydrogenase
MSRIVILDSHPADQGATDWWQPLAAPGDDLAVHPRSTPAQALERAAGAAVAVTNKVRFDAAAFDRLPDLRHLAVSATGTNIVDLAAAKARGIAVSNVPGYSTGAVAQLVLAYLLERSCGLRAHDALTRSGGWHTDFCVLAAPVRELAGQTLAVVGMGAIGSAVARLAGAFGMRVIAAAVPGSASAGRVPLAEALAQADAVTLHCPLTPATDRLAGASFFAAMRPGAILINTGRGGLVDEPAVAAALANGRLAAFAADVLTVEPPAAGHPLFDPAWGHRVLITPHIGWASAEARLRLRDEVAANLAAWRRGEARNRVA